ncbi:hypothetical protein Tco_1278657 [Tanacetum coccineum]
MLPATAPLIGFNGEIIWSMGQILLLVKIGDAEHSTSTWMNFVVVGSSSKYNGIIGRLGVRKIQACMIVSGLEAHPSAITQTTEERIKVTIHPEYPKQIIEIGSTIIKKAERSCVTYLGVTWTYSLRNQGNTTDQYLQANVSGTSAERSRKMSSQLDKRKEAKHKRETKQYNRL